MNIKHKLPAVAVFQIVHSRYGHSFLHSADLFKVETEKYNSQMLSQTFAPNVSSGYGGNNY
jgi:hypothetical protein